MFEILIFVVDRSDVNIFFWISSFWVMSSIVETMRNLDVTEMGCGWDFIEIHDRLVYVCLNSLIAIVE